MKGSLLIQSFLQTTLFLEAKAAKVVQTAPKEVNKKHTPVLGEKARVPGEKSFSKANEKPTPQLQKPSSG